MKARGGVIVSGLVLTLGGVVCARAQQPVRDGLPQSAPPASRPSTPPQPHDGLIHLGQGVTLRAVEAGREDAGRLLRSGRLSRVDLRVPNSFERVYRVESPTLGTSAPARFARVSGALIAIFPQSEYEATETGVRPTVPAGTVFAIGKEAAARLINSGSSAPRRALADRPATAVRTSQRVDTRADMAAPKLTPGVGDVPAEAASVGAELGLPRGRSIWGDEAYRAIRVAELLDRAR